MGVFDEAGVFCVQKLVDTTRVLRQLVREDEIAVRIETVRGADRARPALDGMGSRALHIFLDETGNVVRVHVSKGTARPGAGLRPARGRVDRVVQAQRPRPRLAVILARVRSLAAERKKKSQSSGPAGPAGPPRLHVVAVVRQLTKQKRIATRPPSRVEERNASPVARRRRPGPG